MIQYVGFFFAIIIVFTIAVVLLYMLFGALHRRQLTRTETPKAWLDILMKSPEFKNLLPAGKEQSLSWIKLALGKVSLDGPNEGHIPIEERLMILLKLDQRLKPAKKSAFLNTEVWLVTPQKNEEMENQIVWNGKDILNWDELE